MAYKVLGQVSTTAPTTAATIVNLAHDSSFTGFTLPSTISAAQLNQVQQISSLTPWKFATDTSGVNLTSPTVMGVTTAPFGPTSSSYGVTFGNSGTLSITQGWLNGSNPNTTPTTATFDSASAIPITGNTEYRLGLSIWSTTGGASVVYRVAWYNSSGQYLSQNTPNLNPSAATTWQRVTNTQTSPSNAAFATIAININDSSGRNAFIDGIVFGTNSTYASTFTEPLLPAVASTTSPFDKKIDGFVLNTVFSQSGVTFAGPWVTAYTVPAGKETVVSTLAITNLGTATTYRVAVIPNGTSLAKEDLLFLDVPIAPNSVQAITIGMTLAAGDVVRVAADNALVNATLFGSES
jgi:hypothetical protein